MRALVAVFLLPFAAGCTCDQRFVTLATIDEPLKLTATSIRLEHTRNRPFETTFEYGCVTLWLGESGPPAHDSSVDDETLFGMSCRDVAEDRRIRLSGSPARELRLWVEPGAERVLVKIDGHRQVVLLESGRVSAVVNEPNAEIELADGGVDWPKTAGIIESLSQRGFGVRPERLQSAIHSSSDASARLLTALTGFGASGIGAPGWQLAVDALNPGDREVLHAHLLNRAMDGDHSVLDWAAKHAEFRDDQWTAAIKRTVVNGTMPYEALRLFARDDLDAAARLACEAFEQHLRLVPGRAERSFKRLKAMKFDATARALVEMWRDEHSSLFEREPLVVPAAIIAKAKLQCTAVKQVLEQARCEGVKDDATPQEQADEVAALTERRTEYGHFSNSPNLTAALLAAAAVQGAGAPPVLLGAKRVGYRRIISAKPESRCAAFETREVADLLCVLPAQASEMSSGGCHVNLDDREQTATFTEEAP